MTSIHIQISELAMDKRVQHTYNVQHDILQYLQPSKAEPLGLEVPAILGKEERGLNSHITARFLIPRQHLEAFESDPEGYATLHPMVHRSSAPLGSSPGFERMRIPTGHSSPRNGPHSSTTSRQGGAEMI